MSFSAPTKTGGPTVTCSDGRRIKHSVRLSECACLKPLREDAVLEATIKKRLRERFEVTNQVIVLIGDSTKNLFRFVRWEIETALDLDLPIIAVNLNNKRQMDPDRCPSLLRDKPVVHVAFRARVIKYALDNFPSEYRRRPRNWEGNRFYYDETYRSLGITD
jgi:hypothetical protein